MSKRWLSLEWFVAGLSSVLVVAVAYTVQQKLESTNVNPENEFKLALI